MNNHKEALNYKMIFEKRVILGSNKIQKKRKKTKWKGWKVLLFLLLFHFYNQFTYIAFTKIKCTIFDLF